MTKLLAPLLLLFTMQAHAQIVTCTTTGSPSTMVTITCNGSGTPIPPIPPIPPGNCTINLTVPWVYTANKVIPMGPTDTISIKFVPQVSKSTYSSISGAEWQAPAANRTYTLSTKPCDFGVGVGGYPKTNSSVNASFTVGKPNTFGLPVLTAGATYYLNIMNTAPVTSGSHQMFVNLLP